MSSLLLFVCVPFLVLTLSLGFLLHQFAVPITRIYRML